MESVRQRNDPDSENRLSLGGKKRSSRRSSILKTSKSPMKALEDRDPNSIETDKENRDIKSRRSSSRRVSFAQTYEVKEFSKDDGWNEWEKANVSNSDQKVEKAEYLPSEYRQPSVTIKGLESLLKGDIQNPDRQQQAGSDMDFTCTTFCTTAFNEPSQSQLNSTVGFNNDDALDLTCHGQGLIDQENRAPNITSNYDNMDFTVCQSKMYADETAESTNRTEHALDMTCHGRGVISSDDNTNYYQGPKFCPSSFLQSLVVKPLQEPVIPPTSVSYVQQPQLTAQPPQKVDAAGFLLSLSTTKTPKRMTPHQESEQDVSSTSFLEKLVSSAPFNEHEEEEEMEMTTCLDVPLETTNKTMPDIILSQQATKSSSIQQTSCFYEPQMDMTSCVPTSLMPQTHSVAQEMGRVSFSTRLQGQEAQMDMTSCVPPSLMPQTHSVAQEMSHVPFSARLQGQEAQMDMTSCVPPSLMPQTHSVAQEMGHVPFSARLQGQEAQMDMTSCVPTSLMPQTHSVSQEMSHVPFSARLQGQEAQMDMTSCVPPSIRSQGHSMAELEAHMDMTTCVPSSTRNQGHFLPQESHMDMTACIPSSARAQRHFQSQEEAHMDMTACVPSSTGPQGHPMAHEAHMDMTCVPSSARPQRHPMSENETQMDMTACVPSSARPKVHSQLQEEAHMDMTTCVPPYIGPQGHSMAQEAHMDMTTCVPSSARPKEQPQLQEEAKMDMTSCVPSISWSHEPSPVKDKEMNMIAYGQPPSRTHSSIPEAQIDTGLSCVSYEDEPVPTTEVAHDVPQPPAQQINTIKDKTNTSLVIPLDDVKDISQSYQRNDREAQNRPSFMETNNPSDVKQHDDEPHCKSFSILKENYTQSLLSHTMPLLGSQRTKKSSFQSLPSLSSFILQPNEANTMEPQITFGPTCDVPISQFCTQTAKKQKTTHNTQNNIEHTEEPSTNLPINENNNTFNCSKQGDEMSPEKTSIEKDNNTFTLERQETTADDHTFVLEQQRLPQQECQEPDDGGATFLSQYEREALVEQCNDSEQPDGEISFKAPDQPDNQINITETLTHSSLVGLMDEPTLEFSSDVLDEPQPETKQDMLPQSPKHTFVLSKKPTNLSVICEESDADFNKNSSFNGNPGTDATRKKITVAELLKRANISFNCPILQGSRRSIFGIIKKPEKPKEEKEIIQLSLALKPQAIHYSEFCTSVQKDMEQHKTKIKELEQDLDNSEAPLLYYTSEDEMDKLANKLKELKRTVCKESANARWIQRSGIMKKKLASVLKNNRDQLASDVAAVNDSLAVARDCANIINGIDDELDKEIQVLREKLEKTSKESDDIDEIQSTLKTKTRELEAKETELQQLEERRSHLISSKETLTSQKETLEKENSEREARRAKEESERLAQEQAEERLKEKHDFLRWCLEWELEKWDEHHAKFLFLQKTLELLVIFETGGSSTTDSKPVKSISLSSSLGDTSHISAKFAHSLIQRSLDVKTLIEMSPTTCSLSKVLDHVSSIVSAAKAIGDELYDVCFNNLMTINDTSVSIMFSSMKAFRKFFVELDVNVTKYPDNVAISVKPKIGQVCCEDILSALQAVPTGPKYITRLVDTGRRFLEKK